MENTIIEASAGSGKTFQLSNRYIELICQGIGAENILASTFTVKAAGEILDRILSKLGEAALDDNKFQELKRFVSSCPETRKQLQPIVAKLVKQLYKMRVSTLDSFFKKIASAFSLELGFPADWAMVETDDAEGMFTQAVSNVLRQSNQNNVQKILAVFQKGESKRSITSELVGIAKDYIALYRTTEKEHWVDKHQPLLKSLLSEKELDILIRQLPDAAPTNADGKTIPKRVVEWIEKLSDIRKNGDWQNVCQWIQDRKNNDWKYGQSQPTRNPKLYEQLGEHAAAAEMNKIVGITAATYDLLELIAKEYEKITKQKAGYRFDDVTDKLCNKQSQFNLDSPELLSHRLNAPADHLLLDEFQDTSLPQWGVLNPFTKNADSHENSKGSVFVVGDKKQAIYAWRGGVAEIFGKVEEELKPVPLPLNTSRRSSQPVIDIVNDLFMEIAQNPLLTHYEDSKGNKRPEYLDAAEEWNKRFAFHETEAKDKKGNKIPGYFSIEITPENANEENSDSEEPNENGSDNSNDDDNTESQTDPYSDYVAQRIKELRDEKPNANIGVLTGRNKEIGKIIDSLQKIGVEASEEAGVALTDSNAIQVVLSAMKLADHPGDTTALFHLIHSPLNARNQKEELAKKALNLPEKFPSQFEDEKQQGDASIQSRKCSTEIRNGIIKNGYGKTVKKYTELLADFCDERDYEKLKKLTELAYQFDEEANGVRTQRFLKRVEAARVDSPKAEKVRVMNYFGSKGLEFDIVVLPDFNEDLEKFPPKYIVSRNSPADPVNWVLKYVNKNMQACLPEDYKKAFSNRVTNEIIERLCILYVAMTRAKHELLIIVPPKKKNKKGKDKFSANFTGIVFTGLGLDIKEYAGIAGAERVVVKKHGDRYWYDNSELSTKPTETKAEKGQLTCKLGKTKIEDQHWVPVAPSSLEPDMSKFQTSSEAAATTCREKPALYGTAIHRCFEAGLKGDWLDDGLKNDSELKELVQDVLITEPNPYTAEGIVKDFKKYIEQPNVKKVFTAPAEKPEVEAERRFAIRDKENKRLLHGLIDRLVIYRNKEGKPTAIEIIDYKTGSQDQSVYTEQMQAYRTAAAKLYDIDKKSIKTSLMYVERDEILEI